jgi:hypothetical protein
MWSDDSSLTLLPTSGRRTLGEAYNPEGEHSGKPTIRKENTQGSLQSGKPSSISETQGRFCDGLSSTIVVQYSVGTIITLHGRSTAGEYVDRLGDQVHPMIQTLFQNNNAVFQDASAPIHTSGTVQLWFQEHEGELQHLWPAQSPDLNVTDNLISFGD